MKKKRSSSTEFSLKSEKIFNILISSALITILSVICSNAQSFREYENDDNNNDYDFEDLSAFNNVNRPVDDGSSFTDLQNNDFNNEQRPADFPVYSGDPAVDQNNNDYSITEDDGRDRFGASTDASFRNEEKQFPEDQDFNNQQQYMNTFQNNEQGSDTPISPWQNNVGPKYDTYDRGYDRGPDVDEFNNPLDDIHSTDTTRFELGTGGDADARKCPRHWYQNEGSCYKFTRSPELGRDDASELCREYRHQPTHSADLASISSLEEHRFIIKVLNKIDPQHRRWYISAKQTDQNTWRNEGDKTLLQNLLEYFLQDDGFGGAGSTKKESLSYGYSNAEGRWGFLPVYGDDEYLFICEMPIEEVSYLMTDDRTFQYGEPIGDPRYYPMGPFFVRPPNNTVFNVGRRKIVNDVSLLCFARGWPTPSYSWYREVYRNDSLVEEEVNPLKDSRVTISGGQLIINSPDQIKDRGKYFCKASNKFGTIRSRSVSIAFGFIGEFILRRSDEVGSENWGKAISCDPPQHFPDIKYYWSRDYFPNFVEEDRRVMVSHDGYLYVTALEKIDIGNYSCSVQSSVANHGRNGPFFSLKVTPHPDYQQLRFPQNFPKVFPEAPVAGEDVRLECIAFGYPVPHYNWTRQNSDLPEGAIITNHQRVLILRRVRVEDQGTYICRAHNDKVSITGSVVLSIQSRPVFTISIGDKHIDEHDDLTWTCEAFGIPDVEYAWLKNGRPIYDWKAHNGEQRICKRRRRLGNRKSRITFDKDAPGTELEDRKRYEIKCGNVLKIRKVQKDRDEGMYQCVAFNDLDTRYSSGQLRVLGETTNKEKWRPSFAKHPLEEKMFAAEGGNITIKCEPEGAPQPKFKWKKDGNTIASGGKYIIDRNGTRLFIRHVNQADEGTYACMATNKNGQAESHGFLRVINGPSFQGSGLVNKPNPRVKAFIGNDVKLKCSAAANQRLDMAYSWRLNGLKIRYFEDDEAERILTLKNAPSQRSDVRAGAGGDRTFLELSAHERLLKGSSAWYKGAVDKYTKGTGNYNKYTRGALEGTLIINNITYAEAGRYECVINSAVGTIYAHSDVVIRGKPGKPGGVAATNLDSQSGKVIWTDGINYGSEIRWYTIEGRTNHDETWVTLADRVEAGEDKSSNSRRIKVDGRKSYALYKRLSPFAQYHFRVAAENIYGLGPFSDPSPSYSTLAAKPMKAVTGVIGGGGRTGDLKIEWDPLPPQDHNAQGVYYRVFYRRKYIDPERDFNQDTMKKPNEIGYSDWQTRNGKMVKVIRIDQRYYFTEYEVKIQVFNEMCESDSVPVCEGPMSEPVEINSAEDLPQVAPSTVGARPYNSTALNITWTPVPNVREKIRGKLIGHRIKYWRRDLNETTESQYLLSRTRDSNALIIGLQPNAYYWVRVMAYNQAGPGPESERFLERTFKLRPQKPPTAVQVYGINPSTIRVTWRYVAPSVEEEPLTGYKVRLWETDKDVSQANDTIVIIGNRLETTIPGLTAGAKYYLRVLAFSQGGEGKMSSPVWQFQMGDADVFSSVEAGPHFIAIRQSATIMTIAFTVVAIFGQFFIARIL